MKVMGMSKKVDSLGRLSIPVEMRRTLGIEIGDTLDVTIQNGCLVLTPLKFRCAHCGEKTSAHSRRIGGIDICPGCITKILRYSPGRGGERSMLGGE